MNKNFFEKSFDHIRNNTKKDDRVVKYSVVGGLIDNHIAQQKNSVPVEQILGPESRRNVQEVSSLVKSKIAERGVMDFPLVPIVFSKTIDTNSAGSFRSSGIITISNRDIDNLEIKKLVLMKTLAHELYHSLGRISHVAEETHSGFKLKIKPEFMGASFVGGTKDVDDADDCRMLLEEGGAVQFEGEVFSELRRNLPKEVSDIYGGIISKGKDELKKNNPNLSVSENSLLITVETEGRWDQVYNLDYANSCYVVEYLAEKIPDFYKIFEAARVEGKAKTTALARVIEGTFGEGWYRKLTTATVEQAADILEELKSVPLKQS